MEPYLRGDLGPAREAELEQHLDDCTDCALQALTLRTLELRRHGAEERDPAPARVRGELISRRRQQY